MQMIFILATVDSALSQESPSKLHGWSTTMVPLGTNSYCIKITQQLKSRSFLKIQNSKLKVERG